jgi:hypothetical protein
MIRPTHETRVVVSGFIEVAVGPDRRRVLCSAMLVEEFKESLLESVQISERLMMAS